MLLFYIFGLILEWFPVAYGYNPDLQPGWSLQYIGSVLYHAILPILSMVLVSIGGWLFGMRNSMINLLGEDFITMGIAKGLPEKAHHVSLRRPQCDSAGCHADFDGNCFHRRRERCLSKLSLTIRDWEI